MDHMDMLKPNDRLRKLVGEEKGDGYIPHQIIRNLRGRPKAEAVLIAGGGRAGEGGGPVRRLGIAERKEVEHKQAEGFDMMEEEANTAEGGDMT